MKTDVTRELLTFAAWRCGFPPTEFGALLLSDEGAWRYAIRYAAPTERVALLVRLQRDLMVASEGARIRMADQGVRSRWDADVEPLIVGDLAAVPIIKAALALVPAPARYSLIRDVVFYCVGISAAAYTCSAKAADAGGRVKSIAIHLGPAVDVAVVLHELSHALHKRIHEDSQVVSAEGTAAFIEHMAAVDPDRIARWERSEELLADATALSWLHAHSEAPAA